MGRWRARAVGAALLAASVTSVTAVPVAAGDAPSEPPPDAGVTDAEPAALDWRGSRPDDADVDELAAVAKEAGSVRVIAGLPVEWTPEGYLSASGIKRQRTAIGAAQRTVLELSGDEALLRTYQSVPFVAMNVDVELLFLLVHAGVIASLAPDEVNVTFLDGSTRLIGAQTANNRGYRGASRAVAIIDSGVDTSHSFLAGRVIDEACFGMCPDGSATMTGAGAAAPCSVSGDCDHGTHVAGIAAGAGGRVGLQNFNGVAPQASIVAVQVFQSFSNSPADPPGQPACGPDPSPCLRAFNSDVIAGLEHVLDLKRRGTRVDAANLSLGSTATFSAACDTSPFKPVIDNLRSFGVATVIATGNAGATTGVSSPACVSTAIAVGATTKSDTPWASTNYSSTLIDLLAPGEDITSSVPGGGYQAMSGTSQAAPHVAGAWALLRQRRPNMPVAVGLRVLAQGPRLLLPRSFLAIPRIDVDDALRRLRDPHDYNGDGRTDLAVFRPQTGTWLVDAPLMATPWGQSGDIPVPADYDGNGSTDLAVFRPSTSTWWLQGQAPIVHGAPSGSVPVPGDYNGDGAAELTVWVPQTGQWQRLFSGNWVQWGQSGDIPVPGDYDGNGTTDYAVWRPSTGQWIVKDQRTVVLGVSGDVPVPDDYDHDGRTDYAVWRPATGQWGIVDSVSLIRTVDQWGQFGDIPAPRDMNGDGLPEHVIFRPSRGEWWYRYPWMSPAPIFASIFGASGDIPV